MAGCGGEGDRWRSSDCSTILLRGNWHQDVSFGTAGEWDNVFPPGSV